MDIYLVGGAVRDGLLGLPVYDRDWVVVGSSVDEMLAQDFQQVGKNFPVFLHSKTKEEYALARTERKKGVGYHGFEVFADASVTLEKDLIRRDLTINAIAEDDKGNLIDPYGGIADIENKILCHVSPAFAEDPLRVLRVARFAARFYELGFRVSHETLTLMKKMVASGELDSLIVERVWQEVAKALKTDKPSIFFEVLRQVGAVEVLFPDLHKLIDVEQPVIYHPEGDVWIHSMMVLDAVTELSDDLAVRFSALVHDLGKGLTPKKLYPRHYGHEKAGVPLVVGFCNKYRLPNDIKKLAKKTTEFHGIIHQGLTEKGKPYLKAKTYLKVISACLGLKNDGFFDDVLVVCEADIKGRLGFEDKPYPQRKFWQKLAIIARNVDNKKILATGVNGVEIGKKIKKLRHKKIKFFLRKLKNE
jgi:tRNA nucleotidyltransferase (CCA-adding enzyme)